MLDQYTTPRLFLNRLAAEDSVFIKALLNTAGWIKFIGNRNINTLEDAGKYIEKINANPSIVYWVVRLREDETPIGIITYIKRDYLTHPDIGFAFLDEYKGKGFAFEAASVVLESLFDDNSHEMILATTLKENETSIALLQKLGFKFNENILVGEEELMAFGRSLRFKV
jgi:RimJ/RimL family protein N-acetyltransferase